MFYIVRTFHCNALFAVQSFFSLPFHVLFLEVFMGYLSVSVKERFLNHGFGTPEEGALQLPIGLHWMFLFILRFTVWINLCTFHFCFFSLFFCPFFLHFSFCVFSSFFSLCFFFIFLFVFFLQFVFFPPEIQIWISARKILTGKSLSIWAAHSFRSE